MHHDQTKNQTFSNKRCWQTLVGQQGDKTSKSKKPQRKTVLCKVIWFLDIDAIFCESRSQVLHSQSVLLILYREKTKIENHKLSGTKWLEHLRTIDNYLHHRPLSTLLFSSHTARSKYCIEVLHLKHMLKFETLTFVLLLELPDAVPFILQYCSASLAMSEINFWEAREIRRILKKRKRKLLLWFSLSVHSQPGSVYLSILEKNKLIKLINLISFPPFTSKKSLQEQHQINECSTRLKSLYFMLIHANEDAYGKLLAVLMYILGFF